MNHLPLPVNSLQVLLYRYDFDVERETVMGRQSASRREFQATLSAVVLGCFPSVRRSVPEEIFDIRVDDCTANATRGEAMTGNGVLPEHPV